MGKVKDKTKGSEVAEEGVSEEEEGSRGFTAAHGGQVDRHSTPGSTQRTKKERRLETTMPELDEEEEDGTVELISSTLCCTTGTIPASRMYSTGRGCGRTKLPALASLSISSSSGGTA